MKDYYINKNGYGFLIKGIDKNGEVEIETNYFEFSESVKLNKEELKRIIEFMQKQLQDEPGT